MASKPTISLPWHKSIPTSLACISTFSVASITALGHTIRNFPFRVYRRCFHWLLPSASWAKTCGLASAKSHLALPSIRWCNSNTRAASPAIRLSMPALSSWQMCCCRIWRIPKNFSSILCGHWLATPTFSIRRKWLTRN